MLLSTSFADIWISNVLRNLFSSLCQTTAGNFPDIVDHVEWPGVFERRKTRSFCKSLSSQLRSYRLRRRCIAPIFSPLFDRSIVPTPRIFSFLIVLFSILGANPSLPNIQRLCEDRLWIIHDKRANERDYGRKSDFMYHRSPDVIYNRQELVARTVNVFQCDLR